MSANELDEFTVELHGPGTADWPPVAMQHHEAVVVTYWKDRATQ